MQRMEHADTRLPLYIQNLQDMRNAMFCSCNTLAARGNNRLLIVIP